MSGLLHSAFDSRGSYMSKYVPVGCSYLSPSNIPLHGYAIAVSVPRALVHPCGHPCCSFKAGACAATEGPTHTSTNGWAEVPLGSAAETSAASCLLRFPVYLHQLCLLGVPSS